MENKFGKNVQKYDRVIIKNSEAEDNVVLANNVSLMNLLRNC